MLFNGGAGIEGDGDWDAARKVPSDYTQHCLFVKRVDGKVVAQFESSPINSDNSQT